MKRIILSVLGVLTVSAGADAQSTAQTIERAVLAAPARGRDAAMVIQWNADYTYRTLREGTSQLVCYDRSGDPGQPAFAVACTVQGTRVPPVFGSATWTGSHKTGGLRHRAETARAFARWWPPPPRMAHESRPSLGRRGWTWAATIGRALGPTRRSLCRVRPKRVPAFLRVAQVGMLSSWLPALRRPT